MKPQTSPLASFHRSLGFPYLRRSGARPGVVFQPTHAPRPEATCGNRLKGGQAYPEASDPGKQAQPSNGRWLRKVARGCLALAGLAIASCAHCPMCSHGEMRGKSHCGMHNGGDSCARCATAAGAKGAGAKAGACQTSCRQASSKRKAKAEPPVGQPPAATPFWFRWH